MGQIKEKDNKDIVSDLQSEYESDIQIEEDKKYKCDYPDCNEAFSRPSKLKLKSQEIAYWRGNNHEHKNDCIM